MQEELIIPEFRVVAFQEDEWDEDFLKECGGSILSVYMYDCKQVTTICDVQERYWLRLVEVILAIHYDDDEDLYDRLESEALAATADDYFHCGTIDAMPFPSENHRFLGSPTEEEAVLVSSNEIAYKELEEEWYEYARCNGGLYAGRQA